MVPFLEVLVPSAADLSDATEVLTDLDVVGVEAAGDGALRRVLFDCKTTNKMSSINRAFWAAGVMAYTGCVDAHVILKGRAVYNHRLSALTLGVDLHDEASFKDFARTVDPTFPQDNAYQGSIDRWNALYDVYTAYNWASPLYDSAHHATPLSQEPAAVFRRLIGELRGSKGHVDPEKLAHVALFLDVLASALVLWSTMARDIRRIYDPAMAKADFEKAVRYYVWGGKESYNIRQQLRRDRSSSAETTAAMELPAWDGLLGFAGIVVGAPQAVLDAAYVARELAIRLASSAKQELDESIRVRLRENSRVRQFAIGLSGYLTAAGGLPNDLHKKVQAAFADF